MKVMKASMAHARSLIGKPIKFKNWRGDIVKDVVRDVFVNEILLEPYARNKHEVAIVLTEYSWIPLKQVLS